MDFDSVKDKVGDFVYAIKTDRKKKAIAIGVVVLLVVALIYFQ